MRLTTATAARAANYSQTELREWAQRIAAWGSSELDVYAYCNNDWEVSAPRNAVDLRRMPAAAGAAVGEPAAARAAT